MEKTEVENHFTWNYKLSSITPIFLYVFILLKFLLYERGARRPMLVFDWSSAYYAARACSINSAPSRAPRALETRGLTINEASTSRRTQKSADITSVPSANVS